VYNNAELIQLNIYDLCCTVNGTCCVCAEITEMLPTILSQLRAENFSSALKKLATSGSCLVVCIIHTECASQCVVRWLIQNELIQQHIW